MAHREPCFHRAATD